ncbi:cell division protein ZapE [Mesobaculum littorinae]|uniref:Cell division protein ZapE n=1 Tax=Mesobaculum littorinae TaxID=2486419 RepID=A0A438AHD4_9RHOB|nr:cell division protein ZapE [Mesobaculum littorinae]RVV98074.1 cell division protein ZapE [Mesobaculum littorinae]
MSEDMRDLYAARVADGGLTADPAQEAVLDEFQRILDALEAPEPRRGFFGWKKPEPVRGLYLWGGVGRGKSMLMDLFFAAAPTQDKRRVHFHAFMQEIHAGLDRARKRGVDDAIKPVAEEIGENLRLLCFDEMQISDVADAMIVGRLFERLFEAGVVIVTTSNRVPDDLYKDGLNRQIFLPFIELLKQHMAVRELDAVRDYRQDRLAGSEVYFTPADRAARTEMDRIWADLADGPGEGLTLKVKGREVAIPAYSNGVARAGFWDLCGRPLGAADYLALAEAVRVLMLEDVPQLSSANFNEARRFVTLIDALYEARTRLIVSAAAIPENLYIEGEGSFEFERTASRLREMQSEGWGGAG